MNDFEAGWYETTIARYKEDQVKLVYALEQIAAIALGMPDSPQMAKTLEIAKAALLNSAKKSKTAGQ